MDAINNGVEYIIMTFANALIAAWKPIAILYLLLYCSSKLLGYFGFGNWLYIEFDSNDIKMTNLKNGKKYNFPSELNLNELSKEDFKKLKLKRSQQNLVNGFKHDRCVLNDIDIAGKTILYRIQKIFHVIKPNIILKPTGYNSAELAKFEKDQLLNMGKISGIKCYIFFGNTITSIKEIKDTEVSNWYKTKPKIKSV